MIPSRYVPNSLTSKDRKTQRNMILKSRKMYKQHKYYTRKKVNYKSIKSKHLANAYRIYGVTSVKPSIELSLKTGCTLSGLNQIVKKGEGAYYSSGSRPNQTPQSWGLARLASSITAGNAARVDYDILEKNCDHKKKAFLLAKKRFH